MALEQQTILAIMRVVASFSDNLSPRQPSSPLPSTSPSPPPPASPGDDVRTDPTAGVSPSAFLPPPVAGDGGGGGGGNGGSGDVSMPMLPPGVSVSVVVDLAAMSVALTEGGVNVAAVALSAAHCKVNVSIKCKMCWLVGGAGLVGPLCWLLIGQSSPPVVCRGLVPWTCAGDARVEDVHPRCCTTHVYYIACAMLRLWLESTLWC